MDAGLGAKDAFAAAKIGNLPHGQFEKVVNRAHPPAPSSLVATELVRNPLLSRFKSVAASMISVLDRAHEEGFVDALTDLDARAMRAKLQELIGSATKLQGRLQVRNSQRRRA
jgi:hypothetical protein